MSNGIGGLLNICQDIVQPHLAQSCFLCGGRSHAGLLCPACHDDLPVLPTARCPVCAAPSFDGAVCGACLRRPPAFACTTAVYRYGHPVDILVQQFKYSGQIHIADFMARRLVEGLAPQTRPDVIVAMPLHPRWLAERGFNQAALLAARVGRLLDVEVAWSICRRVRDTPPQVALPLKMRRKDTCVALLPVLPVWPAAGCS